MTEAPSAPPAASRQERRKAETRRKIISAAETLFAEKGYTATSIEDISTAADVAVRTIYLHFASKAGIVLSYFDAWLDAFTQAIKERPVDEPVADTVTEALSAMSADGWVERVEHEESSALPHPLVDLLRNGPADVAGHVTQRWLAAAAELAADAAERTTDLRDPLAPYARSMAIFTFWFAALGAAAEKLSGGPVPQEADAMGILRRITSGI